MPAKKGKKVVHTWVDEAMVKRVDALADSFGISRAKLLENLISVNVPELEVLNKTGLFKFAVILKDLKASMKAWSEHCVESPEYVGACEVED